MSPAAISEAVFSLSVAERVALADQLYASVPEEWQKEVDQAWLDEASRRSADMDADPNVEHSQEEFFAGIRLSKALK